MSEELNLSGDEENLKAENDFLKMKLMLERGAYIGGENKGLPAEVENQFLNNVMAFEKQFEERKTIKLFDKIGRPQHLKPISEISDSEVNKAWNELHDYLNEHGIDLDVCSPNITNRELYRFATEELFEHEMDDLNLPGWTTNFIYDEFHADPVYESEKVVKDDLFARLFSIDPIGEYFHCLHDKDIFLNGKLYAEATDIKETFNRFKSFYKKIRLQKIAIKCNFQEVKTIVKGNYKALATAIENSIKMNFQGNFMIELQPDDLGYWSIKLMQIEGIDF
jgi:hypothetical protein